MTTQSRGHGTRGEQIVALAIVAGAVVIGLQIIATAQVFQCLMQIEINTRREETSGSAGSGYTTLNLIAPTREAVSSNRVPG